MQAAWRSSAGVFVPPFVFSLDVCVHACVSVDEEAVNDKRVVRLFPSPGQK